MGIFTTLLISHSNHSNCLPPESGLNTKLSQILTDLDLKFKPPLVCLNSLTW